jgi:hypothetical protein
MGMPKPRTEQELRSWVAPYIDPGAEEHLLCAVLAQVNAVTQSGGARRWPGSATMTILTEYKLLLASAEMVLPVPWFLVTGWDLTGERLSVSWFAVPGFSYIDNLDILLDKSALKKQRKVFRPLIERLLEMTNEGLSDKSIR